MEEVEKLITDAKRTTWPRSIGKYNPIRDYLAATIVGEVHVSFGERRDSRRLDRIIPQLLVCFLARAAFPLGLFLASSNDKRVSGRMKESQNMISQPILPSFLHTASNRSLIISRLLNYG